MIDCRAYKLAAIESKFKKTLNAAGRQFEASAGWFSGLVRLTSKDGSSFYYNKAVKKVKIVQHLTHGILTGDLWTLTQPNNHVSVHYVIARDGTIYQLFDDEYWSYNLGGTSSAPNGTWSSKSLSIEISNIGPLVEDKLNPEVLNDTYGKAYCLKSDTKFYTKCAYRGYDFFATLTDQQYDATNNLVTNLCKKHDIVFTKAPIATAFDYCGGIPTQTYYFHSNVRKDKLDCGPSFNLDKITATMEPVQENVSVSDVQSTKKTYIVKAGDTLWAIAHAFGVSLQQLELANKDINPNKISPGDLIVIP